MEIEILLFQDYDLLSSFVYLCVVSGFTMTVLYMIADSRKRANKHPLRFVKKPDEQLAVAFLWTLILSPVVFFLSAGTVQLAGDYLNEMSVYTLFIVLCLCSYAALGMFLYHMREEQIEAYHDSLEEKQARSDMNPSATMGKDEQGSSHEEKEIMSFPILEEFRKEIDHLHALLSVWSEKKEKMDEQKKHDVKKTLTYTHKALQEYEQVSPKKRDSVAFQVQEILENATQELEHALILVDQQHIHTIEKIHYLLKTERQ